jgi:hypothetical protein
MSGACITGGMARPEIDDKHIEKMEEIIDDSVVVPLPSDELSVNQQFRIIIDVVYTQYQKAKEEGEETMLLADQ